MKGTFAPLAQKGREKRERERQRGEKERRRGRRREKKKKESWQLLGACGVGPFKARSPDARRRNCPPRVAPHQRRYSRPPCVFPLRRPRHLLEKSTNRVATASMKSHPPRVSPFLLPNLFFSLCPSRIVFTVAPLRSEDTEYMLLPAILNLRSNELRDNDGIFNLFVNIAPILA